MKKPLRRKLFFTALFHFSLHILAGSMWFATAQDLIKEGETGISFPKNLYSSPIDFKLKSIGNKKFKVVLDNETTVQTPIKIYDIVGNLLVEDKIKPEDGKEKEFDFSRISSKLFVVEVGNSKYNKTKSIYAQSPGSRQEVMESAEALE